MHSIANLCRSTSDIEQDDAVQDYPVNEKVVSNEHQGWSHPQGVQYDSGISSFMQNLPSTMDNSPSNYYNNNIAQQTYARVNNYNSSSNYHSSDSLSMLHTTPNLFVPQIQTSNITMYRNISVAPTVNRNNSNSNINLHRAGNMELEGSYAGDESDAKEEVENDKVGYVENEKEGKALTEIGLEGEVDFDKGEDSDDEDDADSAFSELLGHQLEELEAAEDSDDDADPDVTPTHSAPLSETTVAPTLVTPKSVRTVQPNYTSWKRVTLRSEINRRTTLLGKKPGFLVTYNKDQNGFCTEDDLITAASTTQPLSKIRWADKKSASQQSVKQLIIILKGNDEATLTRDRIPLWHTCPLSCDRLSAQVQAGINNKKAIAEAREGLSSMKTPNTVARFFSLVNDTNHVNEFVQIEDGETRTDFENRTIGKNSQVFTELTRNYATAKYCVNHRTALVDDCDENGKNCSIDENGKRKKVSDARKPIYPSKPNWTVDVSALDPRNTFEARAIKLVKELAQVNPRDMSLVNAIRSKHGDGWESALREKLWSIWKEPKAQYARSVANKDQSGNNQPNFACFTPSIYPLIMHAYMKDANNEDIFAVFTRETVPGGTSTMHEEDDIDNEVIPVGNSATKEKTAAAKREALMVDTLADINREFKRSKNENRDVSSILRDIRETRSELKSIDDDDDFMKENLTKGLTVLQTEYRRVVEENAAKEKL